MVGAPCRRHCGSLKGTLQFHFIIFFTASSGRRKICDYNHRRNENWKGPVRYLKCTAINQVLRSYGARWCKVPYSFANHPSNHRCWFYQSPAFSILFLEGKHSKKILMTKICSVSFIGFNKMTRASLSEVFCCWSSVMGATTTILFAPVKTVAYIKQYTLTPSKAVTNENINYIATRLHSPLRQWRV